MSPASDTSEESIKQDAVRYFADASFGHIGNPITDRTIESLVRDNKRMFEEYGFKVLNIEVVPQEGHPHVVDLQVTLRHSPDISP